MPNGHHGQTLVAPNPIPNNNEHRPMPPPPMPPPPMPPHPMPPRLRYDAVINAVGSSAIPQQPPRLVTGAGQDGTWEHPTVTVVDGHSAHLPTPPQISQCASAPHVYPPWAMNLIDHVKSIEGQLTSLQQTVKSQQTIIESLREEARSQYHEIRSNRNCIVDLTDRSMRDNLIFSGVPESRGEDPEKCVTDIVRGRMGIKHVEFERVHRGAAGRHGHPRPIIAKFSKHKTKELVRQNAKN